jgi:DNA-binding response OmpR family regulator
VRAFVADSLVTTVPERQYEPVRILIIEDDPTLAWVLRQLLTGSGFETWAAASGAEARAQLEHGQPDLILLDLMLPDTDGLVLISTLKVLSSAAIIILSARAEQVDRVLGRKLGADDFVAKPFDPEELLVRIEAVLRRARPHPPPTARPPDRVQVGRLTLARGGGPVTIGSTPVHLTPTEHRLLLVLADHADQVVSRAMLLRLVWGYEDPSAGHLIDVHLGRLRLKFTRSRVSAPAIVTVRGLGFKLVSQPVPPGDVDTADRRAIRGGSAHPPFALTRGSRTQRSPRCGGGIRGAEG